MVTPTTMSKSEIQQGHATCTSRCDERQAVRNAPRTEDAQAQRSGLLGNVG